MKQKKLNLPATKKVNARYNRRLMILPNKRDKNGMCWIYCEVVITYEIHENGSFAREERQIRRYNSGKQVHYRHWDVKREKTKTINFDVNKAIFEYKLEVEEAIKKATKGESVKEEFKEIDEIFNSTQKTKQLHLTSVTTYFDQYIKYRKDKNTPHGTLKEFKTAQSRIDAFQKDTGTIITLPSINLTLSDKMIQYFSNKVLKPATDTTPEKRYHPNTIKKTFEIFKTMLNHFYARREELNLKITDNFKSKDFGAVKEHQTPPVPLTDVEVELIQEFDLEEYRQKELASLSRKIATGELDAFKEKFYLKNLKTKIEVMEKTRKLMLLQMSTGLRVSDLFKIKPAMINDGIIKMNPTKTMNVKADNTIFIPLNSISKAILKEAKYNSATLKISSQNYNNNIKELLRVVGIDNEVEVSTHSGINNHKKEIKRKCDILTSHNLRDTFISKAIRQNVPIPVILRATGQSSYEVMKKYIKLENKDMVEHLGNLF